MAERPPARPVPGGAELLKLGTTTGVCIGLGVFLGYLLDQAAGTSPLLTFVGMAVGILAAATGAYYLLRPFVTGTSEGRQTPKE